MDYRKFYEENKKTILPILYELGYTPNSLVKDAEHDKMDVFEYIKVLTT